jgi:ferredoxin--NADP+ reductase
VSEQQTSERPLRVAIVGAGPAGIYAADVLMKSGTDVSIDLYERQPAPFGLIRYGVAPDHPRIKGIVKALHQVLSKPQVRLLGNVEYGVDVKLDELRRYYDAVVFTTGAEKDRDLDVPGVELPGSFGGAEFVSWFDGHPDVPRDWPLEAESIAVVGAGNVGLDVARMLSKTADELLVTEIPDNVYEGLKASPVREVHVFARRGPAQAKFTPLELRELDHSPNVEVLVNPEDIEYDDGSVAAINSDNQTKLVVRELEKYAMRTADKGEGERPRKLWLHFFESPVEIVGDGKVEAFRTERTELDGTGNVKGTGVVNDWPVQAVYRCVGYRSTELPGLPWDSRNHVVPHAAGRCSTSTARRCPASTSTAGSSAARSASSATPRATRSRPSARCSRTSTPMPRPSSPTRPPSSSSSSSAACSGRPGTAGSCSTRTSRRSARRTASSASRPASASRSSTARR